MKGLLLLLIILGSFSQAYSQFVHIIKAGSVLITNDSCTAELNLENGTKHIKDFLYNKGNGRTEFRKAKWSCILLALREIKCRELWRKH